MSSSSSPASSPTASSSDWAALYASLYADYEQFRADSGGVESELEAQLADAQSQVASCQRRLQQSQQRAEEERSHSAARVAQLEARTATVQASAQSAAVQLERLRGLLVASEQAHETANNRVRALEAQCAAQQETIESQTELLVMARQEMEELSEQHSTVRAQRRHNTVDAHTRLEHDKEWSRDGVDGVGSVRSDNGSAGALPSRQQPSGPVSVASSFPHLSPRASVPSSSSASSVDSLCSPYLVSSASLLLSSLTPHTSDRLRDFIARTDTLHSAASTSQHAQHNGHAAGMLDPTQPLSEPSPRRRPNSLVTPLKGPRNDAAAQAAAGEPSPATATSPSRASKRGAPATSMSHSLQTDIASSNGGARTTAANSSDSASASIALSSIPAQPAPVSAGVSRLVSDSAYASLDSSAVSGSGLSPAVATPPQRPSTPPPLAQAAWAAEVDG